MGDYPATCTTDGFTGNIYHACCYSEEEGADNSKALIKKGEKIKANGQHVLGEAVPEYMLDLDEEGNAVILEEKDEDGKVISKTLKVKAEAPDYDGKVDARRDDDKWYHAQICEQCGQVVYEACYTYAHTYSCVDTDICEVCEGLCSLKDSSKHKDGLEKVEGTPANCITDGVKAYYKCDDCGKTYLDEAGKTEFDLEKDADKLVIKKTGVHKNKLIKTEEGTCGKEGTETYECEICKTQTVVKTGFATNKHEWSTEYTVTDEPTCSKNGYKAILCSVCDAVKPNSYVTIPATGEHDLDKDKDGDVDRDDAVATPGESCVKPGTLTYTCQNEGCTYEKVETDTEGVSAHAWGDWITVGGDCSTGILQERECSVCHEKEKKTETTNAHSYELSLRVEPTAEADGYEIYKCANCGVEYREELPYNGSGEGGEGGEGGGTTVDEHLIVESEYTVKEYANCEHGEIRRYVCLRCGETVEKEVGEPTEHVWLKQSAEIATCTKAGQREHYRCVRCLAIYDDGKGEIEIKQLDHADNDGDGKCDGCNAAYYDGGNSTCSCICHKEGWFMQLIYKILNFFWKLFKIGRTCDCGATHY